MPNLSLPAYDGSMIRFHMKKKSNSLYFDLFF
jgi:hypothetical protein